MAKRKDEQDAAQTPLPQIEEQENILPRRLDSAGNPEINPRQNETQFETPIEQPTREKSLTTAADIGSQSDKVNLPPVESPIQQKNKTAKTTTERIPIERPPKDEFLSGNIESENIPTQRPIAAESIPETPFLSGLPDNQEPLGVDGEQGQQEAPARNTGRQRRVAAPQSRTGTISQLSGGGQLLQIGEGENAEAYVIRRTASGIKRIKVSRANVEKLLPRVASSEQISAVKGRRGWEIQRTRPEQQEQAFGEQLLRNQLQPLLQEILNPLFERIVQSIQEQSGQQRQQERQPETQTQVPQKERQIGSETPEQPLERPLKDANIQLGRTEEGQQSRAAGNEPVVVRLQPGTRFRIDENSDTIEVVS